MNIKPTNIFLDFLAITDASQGLKVGNIVFYIDFIEEGSSLFQVGNGITGVISFLGGFRSHEC